MGWRKPRRWTFQWQRRRGIWKNIVFSKKKYTISLIKVKKGFFKKTYSAYLKKYTRFCSYSIMEEKIVLPVGHCVSLHRFPFGGCASRSAACATLVEERRLRRQERRRHHREQRRQAVVVPGNVGKHLDFPHANLCRNENSPFGDSNAPRLLFLHTLIFRFFFFLFSPS